MLGCHSCCHLSRTYSTPGLLLTRRTGHSIGHPGQDVEPGTLRGAVVAGCPVVVVVDGDGSAPDAYVSEGHAILGKDAMEPVLEQRVGYLREPPLEAALCW